MHSTCVVRESREDTLPKLSRCRTLSVSWRTMSESWHRAVARALAVPTLAEELAEFEIAFGRIREVVTYVLELARAHRLPASGNVIGDDVWILFGQERARFTLNRREEVLIVRTTKLEQRFPWSKELHSVVDSSGRPCDVKALARSAMGELIAQWQADRSPRLAASSSREYEDEPTKG